MAAKRKTGSSEEIEEVRRFNESLLDSLPSSVLIVDEHLRVVQANRNFLVKSRRQPAKVVGRPLSQVLPALLLTTGRLEEKLRAALSTGQPAEGEKLRYRAPGLAERIYYYRVTPLVRPAGEVRQVMLLLEDVTEQERLGATVRQAQSYLASVVESANDLVVSLDARGRIASWNRAAQEVSGYGSEETVGRPLVDFLAGPARVTAGQILGRLRHRSQQDLVAKVRDVELALVSQDGREIPASWNFSPMRGEAGEVTGLVAVGRDLSEHRRLEFQLVQSEKMAALGIMAGGVAHELRNPLAISSAAAELLLEVADDQQLRAKCVARIRDGIARAAEIIDHLLRFGRAPEEQFSPLDCNEALEDALSLVRYEIGERGIQLHMALAPTVPVMGSKGLLQQVFFNLLQNACYAMPQGGQLHLSSTCHQAEVEVRLQDTGSGMSPKNLAKVFDPFFTTRPVGQGTGLGLSISHTIIRQHGGRIEVESAADHGTTFSVWLPAGPVADGRGR